MPKREMHVQCLSPKNQFAQKKSCDSASKQPKSSCEVMNKTYRFSDLYEIIIHSDLIVLGFSKLSIKIGLVHFIEIPCTSSGEYNVNF